MQMVGRERRLIKLEDEETESDQEDCEAGEEVPDVMVVETLQVETVHVHSPAWVEQNQPNMEKKL